jgi:hypothetical protein
MSVRVREAIDRDEAHGFRRVSSGRVVLKV